MARIVTLEPNDILVVHSHVEPNDDLLEDLARMTGCQVIFLPVGMSVSALDDETLTSAGLRRIDGS